MDEVLVVDDDAATCRAVALLLRTAGHPATCVSNGEDALRMLTEMKPQLIVLDIMMRGVDGMEVLRRIRSDQTLDEVAVVMYTAKIDAESRVEADKLGAQGFVIKAGGWAALYPELKKHLKN